MAKNISDVTLDATLDNFALATQLHLCVAEPANFADIAVQSRGSVAVAPADFTKGAGTPNGRQVVVAAKQVTTTGITGTENITHVVLSDGSSNFNVTTTTSTAVTDGTVVNVGSFTLTLPEAV